MRRRREYAFGVIPGGVRQTNPMPGLRPRHFSCLSLGKASFPRAIHEGVRLWRDPGWGFVKQTQCPGFALVIFPVCRLGKRAFPAPSMKNAPCGALCLFAEEKGFEPLIPFRVYTLSRRAPSTTRTLLLLERTAKVRGLKEYWERLAACSPFTAPCRASSGSYRSDR